MKIQLFMRSTSGFTPQPPYFVVKIGKEAQKEKEEKIGSLYFPVQYAYMKRKMQFGEIVAIGSKAAEFMPLASIGDYLIFNHLIEGKKTHNGYNFYLIEEDNDFNYYVVNAIEIPGEKAMAYAVAIGEEIIPTPNYVFLESPKQQEQESFEDVSVNETGLIVRSEKKKTREDWIAIMQANKKRCQDLANVIPGTPLEEAMALHDPARKERLEFARREIKMLEAENDRISKELNKKRYEPFVIAALNPDWASEINEIFGCEIKEGDIGYFLNIATNYKVDFGGTEYIVCETKYFGCPASWAINAVTAYKNDTKRNNSSEKKRAGKV